MTITTLESSRNDYHVRLEIFIDHQNAGTLCLRPDEVEEFLHRISARASIGQGT